MKMNSLVDFKIIKKKTHLAREILRVSDIWIGKVISFFFFGSVFGCCEWICVIEMKKSNEWMNEWMNETGIGITNKSETGGEIRSGAAQGGVQCHWSILNT